MSNDKPAREWHIKEYWESAPGEDKPKKHQYIEIAAYAARCDDLTAAREEIARLKACLDKVTPAYDELATKQKDWHAKVAGLTKERDTFRTENAELVIGALSLRNERDEALAELKIQDDANEILIAEVEHLKECEIILGKIGKDNSDLRQSLAEAEAALEAIAKINSHGSLDKITLLGSVDAINRITAETLARLREKKGGGA